MEKSEQINELAAALAAAQIEIDNPTKTSTNPFFKSKYADLAEVLGVVRPALGKHGLSISQHPSIEGGVVTVTTIMLHSSGQWLQSAISAPAGKDIQSAGAAITYCRRYALSAIAAVSQEDDDGETAKKNPPPAKSDPLPETFTVSFADVKFAKDAAVEAVGNSKVETEIVILAGKQLKGLKDFEVLPNAARIRLRDGLLALAESAPPIDTP